MNEEINQDTNCIIKAFENNPIAIILEQIGDKKVHCFKASDIAKALNIVNIRTSIMNFDEDEVVIRTTYDTIKRMQQTLFLTSQGVYRVLYNSKKPEAKKFRKWVGNILDDIIFNESNELRIQLENHKLELENHKLELEHEKKINKQDKQEILLKSYNKKSVVYLILISEILYKYGYTDDIQKRLLSHRRDYGKNCELIYCIESKNNRLLESQLKESTRSYKKQMTINGIVRTELIETNDINYIKEKLVKLNNKICEDKELLLCKKRILELENERFKIDNLENYNQLLILQNENITKTTFNLELQIKLKQLQLQLRNTTPNTATPIEITTTLVEPEIIFTDDNIIMTQIPELNELQTSQLNNINDKKEKSKLSDKLYREKNAKVIKETRELEENRIKKRAADKLYRENNKEKIKLGKKEYSKKESGKETVKNYYNNNKDEINRKRREYIQSKKQEQNLA